MQLSKVTMTRGRDEFSPTRQLKQSLSVESDNEADDEEQKEDILYLPHEEGPDASDAMARYISFCVVFLLHFTQDKYNGVGH